MGLKRNGEWTDAVRVHPGHDQETVGARRLALQGCETVGHASCVCPGVCPFHRLRSGRARTFSWLYGRLEWKGLLSGNVAEARPLLDLVLADRIGFMPTADRFYREHYKRAVKVSGKRRTKRLSRAQPERPPTQ